MALSLLSILFLFVIAFISNATPFFGASYTLLATTVLFAYGFTINAFVLVVLVTAIGASLAKLVLYYGGKSAKGQLRKNRNVNLLERWLRHRSFLAVVFVTAVIPGLPLDDYVYIVAGANSAKLVRLFTVTFLAKLVKGFIEIGLEYASFGQIFPETGLFGLSRLVTSILLSVVFLLFGIVFFKLDMEKLFSRLKHQPAEPI
ncbi:VTT domain-containing protein [Candidatus Bathyarchaeota archaeon]|nr:MAG: VTT domain-containing protein [Candidatus Bathyarchaeota archaeon]